MSTIIGKASFGRHFVGPVITTPGTGFINVTVPEAAITAKPEEAQLTVAIEEDGLAVELEDIQITAEPQQQPIAVTVIPASIVAQPGGGVLAPFASQGVSVDFDGAEELTNLGPNLMGVGAVFSIGMWYMPDSGAPSGQPVMLQTNEQASPFKNLISFKLRLDVAPVRTEVILFDSQTPPDQKFKIYFWDELADEDEWQLDLFTYDGTTIRMYHNGVLTAPTTINKDETTIMTDTARRISVGFNGYRGRIHSGGMWNVVLAQDEITELWNAGKGRDINWDKNGSVYKSAGALLPHWWRLGFDPADIGKDYGNAATLINVGDDATDIDASDIVIDSP